jgi:hypothetical protein
MEDKHAEKLTDRFSDDATRITQAPTCDSSHYSVVHEEVSPRRDILQRVYVRVKNIGNI